MPLNHVFLTKPRQQTLQKNIQILALNHQFINKTLKRHFMSTNTKHINQIKRSLRSINNCFRIPNMFLNKNQDFLTQNIDFIPKHVRRKIFDKQYLNCKDIVDMDFKSQRPKVDVITVKTAVKIQQNYQNIIFQRDQKTKMRNLEEKQLFDSFKQPKLYIKEEAEMIQSSQQQHKMIQQCIKMEIPTEKEIKKEIDP